MSSALRFRFFSVALSMALGVGAIAMSGEIVGSDAGTGILKLADSTPAAISDVSYQKLDAGNFTITAPAAVIDISSAGTNNKNLGIANGSSLTVAGGDAAVALKVQSLTVEGGSFTATGGSPTGNAGQAVNVLGDLTQNGGTIKGTSGGRNLYSTGIHVAGNLILNGGSLYAYGGTSVQTFGIGVNGDLTQQAGSTIYAAAGKNQGLMVNGVTNLYGKLVLQRIGGTGTRAADFGSSDYKPLYFRAGSILEIDYSGSGGLPYVFGKEIHVETGAEVNFLNTASLPTGTTSHDFAMSSNHSIDGAFTLSAASALLDIQIEKRYASGYHRYTAYFARTGTANDLIAGNPGVGGNAGSLIAGLDALYGDTNPANARLIADLSAFDSMTDSGEIAAHAEYMAQAYTPLDAATMVSDLATGVNGMTQRSMTRNIFAPVAGGFNQAAVSASSTDALASMGSSSGLIRSMWLTPLAQWTRTRPVSGEFSKSQENTYGAGLGFGVRQDYNFAAGVSFHYLRSDFNSRTADIDTDVYGFNLFGRKYFANRGCVNPFVEGGAGYSYADSKMNRKLLGNHADPDSHILNGNLAVGVDYLVGNLTLTPKLGVDYNHVRTGTYTERGASALRVDTDNFDSLRGVAGIGVKSQVNDCLYLTANAAYRHEFADRNAVTSNRFATAPDVLFVTKGERRSRSSGEFGVGLGWQARRNVLVGLNYDLTVAEKQHSHVLAARFSLDF